MPNLTVFSSLTALPAVFLFFVYGVFLTIGEENYSHIVCICVLLPSSTFAPTYDSKYIILTEPLCFLCAHNNCIVVTESVVEWVGNTAVYSLHAFAL